MKFSESSIFRAVRRSVPGAKLQGPSGPQPSKPLPNSCFLVRNAQEGRWKRGLIIMDNITFQAPAIGSLVEVEMNIVRSSNDKTDVITLLHFTTNVHTITQIWTQCTSY